MDYKQKMKMREQTHPASNEIFSNDDVIRDKYEQDQRYLYPDNGRKKRPLYRRILLWAFQLIIVVMIAYVLVYFFGQTRTNVGQSMDTTLSGGDVVLINVMAYQLGSPKRGDIISFKPNGNESSHSSIKRVIGLPGETIQISDGMIQIDGQTYLEQRSFPSITDPGMASEPIKLSDTQYFVLGDNRNNSEDSRFADVGLVSSDMIEGKVWFVISPQEHLGFVDN